MHEKRCAGQACIPAPRAPDHRARQTRRRGWRQRRPPASSAPRRRWAPRRRRRRRARAGACRGAGRQLRCPGCRRLGGWGVSAMGLVAVGGTSSMAPLLSLETAAAVPSLDGGVAGKLHGGVTAAGLRAPAARSTPPPCSPGDTPAKLRSTTALGRSKMLDLTSAPTCMRHAMARDQQRRRSQRARNSDNPAAGAARALPAGPRPDRAPRVV